MLSPRFRVLAVLPMLFLLARPGRADDITVHFWNQQTAPNAATDRVLLFDADTSTTVQMTLENFMVQYEATIAPQIPIVQVRQNEAGSPAAGQVIPDDTPTAVEFDETVHEDDADMHDESVNNSRLIAAIDGLYLFHAVVELTPTATQYSYSASVEKGGATSGDPMDAKFPVGEAYAYALRQPSIRSNSGNIIRVLNLTGTVYLKADQYIELIVWQNSGSGVELVADDFHPMMYMRRLMP